jgi:predicted lipid-binding transport protein (Tim44 family)
MSFSPGTVTVDDQGVATVGDDPAGRLYTLLVGKVNADAAALGVDPPAGEEGAPALKAVASLANVQAAWLAGEFDRLRAAVTTSTSGLQRMPATPDENTDTKAPSAKKLLALEYA